MTWNHKDWDEKPRVDWRLLLECGGGAIVIFVAMLAFMLWAYFMQGG